ncbi:hypothetical protein CY0110_18807 [Crocosphaera chwakensis CCY0110]|uniref:Uncharacterized protein n=1 Tax=Crocosphaera chwakensis CCY0110 TaxID=391612 RepID=A3IJ93_9CHRO|nr:hypothetical protein CY0110_18807 [Crocosphaera chwakensis CCY0110]
METTQYIDETIVRNNRKICLRILLCF